MLAIRTADYSKLNFFIVDNLPTVLHGTKPEGLLKLKLSSPRVPHRLRKNILRRFVIENEEYWIQATAFWISAQDEVVVEGLIYAKSFPQNEGPDNLIEVHSTSSHFISAKFLNHRNDFLFSTDVQLSVIQGLL